MSNREYRDVSVIDLEIRDALLARNQIELAKLAEMRAAREVQHAALKHRAGQSPQIPFRVFETAERLTAAALGETTTETTEPTNE